MKWQETLFSFVEFSLYVVSSFCGVSNPEKLPTSLPPIISDIYLFIYLFICVSSSKNNPTKTEHAKGRIKKEAVRKCGDGNPI